VPLCLGLCSFVGLFVAFAVGEFGSIMYLPIGFVVGISGSISKLPLVRSSRFRSVNTPAQVLALSVGVMLLPTLWILMTAQSGPGMTSRSPALDSLVAFFLPIAGLSVLGACAVRWLARPRPRKQTYVPADATGLPTGQQSFTSVRSRAGYDRSVSVAER